MIIIVADLYVYILVCMRVLLCTISWRTIIVRNNTDVQCYFKDGHIMFV